MKLAFTVYALCVIIYAVHCQDVEVEIAMDEGAEGFEGVNPAFSKIKIVKLSMKYYLM